MGADGAIIKSTLNTDHDWMIEALAQAGQVVCDIPVGALVVKAGKIIGRGHNRREETNDPTAHAEIIAIRAAAVHLGTWRLTDTVLYTTLEPCPMCAEAIIQSRIAKLVFGAYDARSGAAGSAFNLFCQGRIYPIPEIVAGVGEHECQELLVKYFRQKRGVSDGI
jgi:tRNA(adenine34) deaminase